MYKEKTRYTKAQFKKEFAKLMSATSMPNNLLQEESIRVLRELHDFVQPYIPANLFRFRKCGIDEMISFEQGTISMCTANMFSDKYDSNVFYDYHTLPERFNKAFFPIMHNIILALRCNPIIIPDSPTRTKILELIRSSMSDEEILKAIRNDYVTFLEQIKLEVKKLEAWPRNNKNTKIGCFTEKVNSKYMWDLYADGYKVFTLEYDFRKWYALHVNLYPIIYSSQMLDATDMIDRICVSNYVDSVQPDKKYKDVFESFRAQLHQQYPIDSMYFIKMYLFKDKAEYSHEREWRMIKIDGNKADQDFITIPDLGYLKAIYYGMHIEPRYKAHLRMIAKAKEIKEYDVVLDKDSRKYSLKVVPL